MEKWIKRISSVCLIFLSLLASSQDLPIGSWRTHFSYRNARLLAGGDQKIFCAAENGLFFLDLTDNSINKLNRLSALSAVGATSMAYDESTHTLILGYESGLIDLVTSDKVKTLYEIFETNFAGNKTIRDIAIHNKRAYLASSFGIIVISLERQEIGDTYQFIGPNGLDVTVSDLEVIGDQLYAVVDNGIQRGDLSSNLLDFNNWFHYANTSGSYSEFAAVGENVYTIAGTDSLALLQENDWSMLPLKASEPIVDLVAHENNLYVLGEDAIFKLENDNLEMYRNPELVVDANNFLYLDGFWVADGKNGLISPDGNAVIPDGPLSDDITRLSVANGQLYALYGSPENFLQEASSSGYSYFNNQSWYTESIDGFYNITDVVAYNESLYFSSAGFGLYNQTTGEYLNQDNSALTNDWAEMGPVITDLENGELLYAVSYDSTNALYTIDTEGTLQAYSKDFVGTFAAAQVKVSDLGVVWVVRDQSFGGGLFAFELDSDNFTAITKANGLPSNVINGITIDLNDDVWVATPAGPALYPDASFPFSNVQAIKPVFENRELFEDENISAIAVDGGNRIWMSTGSGIYIFNDNISELVASYTLENSPIPSTHVRQFAYNEKSGEMFILTDKGLISLRTPSSRGEETHDQVNIFPNPVRPGYQGLVGINGLVRDASVKITDVNGKLIRQLHANGGTTSWDLLDYNMKRVNSGIYIFFSSSADGEETYIGKIAVIN